MSPSKSGGQAFYCSASHSISLANGRTLAPGDVATDLDPKEAAELEAAGLLVALSSPKKEEA